MARETDVLVVGAGPGGYVAAIRLGQLGKRVLVVEKDRLGGVCLNVGCIPSKAVIHAAKVAKTVRGARELGLDAELRGVDAKALQAWKRGVVDGLTGGIAQLFKANKVDHVLGTARLTGPNAAEVRTKEGASESVRFQHCILATGSRPVEVPGFRFDGKTVLDSTAALDLEEVPRRLAVVGGGFIGLEIGQAFATLGSEVAVVEMMDQLLPGQDPELVRVVERALKKQGVKVFTKAKARSFADGALVVEAGGKEERVGADKVLVAVGRRPNTEDLGLEAAGVRPPGGTGHLEVDRQGRTNVPHIFAIGDLVPGPALAHKASREGLVAAAAIAGDKGAAVDYRAMPWAVFTDPEVATVGLTEAQAQAQGFQPKVGRFPFAASGRARSTNETDGFVKVVADARTDLLLGVHIVGPEASNLIAEAALAIEMGATAKDLALTVHTHPTLPEALMEAAEGVHGTMVHAVNK